MSPRLAAERTSRVARPYARFTSGGLACMCSAPTGARSLGPTLTPELPHTGTGLTENGKYYICIYTYIALLIISPQIVSARPGGRLARSEGARSDGAPWACRGSGRSRQWRRAPTDTCERQPEGLCSSVEKGGGEEGLSARHWCKKKWGPPEVIAGTDNAGTGNA